MDTIHIIDLTPETIADYGVCGYNNVKKHRELQNKIEWFSTWYPKGLRIKVVLSPTGSYQGMIEYIPGSFACRPVNADGYLFIHCIFVGFKKEFKGRGYASALLDECVSEARDTGMLGVAVVTRKGSFMANNDLFLKNGFHIVDSARPDFNLLAKKFNTTSKNPTFKSTRHESVKKYGKGLTILRSPQCPYTEKNVAAIIETAKKRNIPFTLVEMKDAQDVQNSPSPFGSFCLLYNGEILSYHPISNTRFENIMKGMCL